MVRVRTKLLGARGAGAVEYAIMIFLVLVVGFLAWKFLGGEVSKSTKASNNTFQGQGESAGKGGGAAQGGGQTAKPAETSGGGGQGPQQGKQTGGAKVATVDSAGGPVTPNNQAAGRARAGESDQGGRPRNWARLLVIVLVVLGGMAAIFQFGKKGKKAA